MQLVQIAARQRGRPSNNVLELLPNLDEDSEGETSMDLSPEEQLLHDLVNIALTIRDDGQVNPLAVLVLLARFSISQMDVPTCQSYVMAVVDANERSAAAGVTEIVRTLDAACAPVLSGIMLGAGWLDLPFLALKPQEER